MLLQRFCSHTNQYLAAISGKISIKETRKFPFNAINAENSQQT